MSGKLQVRSSSDQCGCEVTIKQILYLLQQLSNLKPAGLTENLPTGSFLLLRLQPIAPSCT